MQNEFNLNSAEDLLGYAVGYMGMSVRDFLGLSCVDSYTLNTSELQHIIKWHQKKMSDEHRSSALICSILANVNRDSKKRSRPYTLDDFMFQKKQKLSTSQLHNKFKAVFGIKK